MRRKSVLVYVVLVVNLHSNSCLETKWGGDLKCRFADFLVFHVFLYSSFLIFLSAHLNTL